MTRSDHPSDGPPGRPVRVRTAATDKRKALEHYQDLRRAGRVARAVVIAEDHEGAVTVLGQMLKPEEIAQLLVIAADALASIDERRRSPVPEALQEPISTGPTVGQTVPTRAITKNPDGTLRPPDGETIISCGECRHPRWYVLFNEATDQAARYSCAHCGNEIVMHAIYHPEGRA